MNDAFDALRKDFEKNKDVWKAWYDLEAPETVETPTATRTSSRLCSGCV